MTINIARTIPSRTTDPQTSHDAYEAIKIRAGSQRAHILGAYLTEDCTDEEAAQRSGVNMRSCWWKRCSELRAGGYIEDTGKTRRGSGGVERMECRLTLKGAFALRKLMRGE